MIGKLGLGRGSAGDLGLGFGYWGAFRRGRGGALQVRGVPADQFRGRVYQCPPFSEGFAGKQAFVVSGNQMVEHLVAGASGVAAEFAFVEVVESPVPFGEIRRRRCASHLVAETEFAMFGNVDRRAEAAECCVYW